jgi:hypothetical protein
VFVVRFLAIPLQQTAQGPRHLNKIQLQCESVKIRYKILGGKFNVKTLSVSQYTRASDSKISFYRDKIQFSVGRGIFLSDYISVKSQHCPPLFLFEVSRISCVYFM